MRPAAPTGADPAPLDVVNAGTWHERGPRIGGRLSSVIVTRSGDQMLVSSPGGGVWRRDSSGPEPPAAPDAGVGGTPWTAPGVFNDGDHTTTHLEWDLDDSLGRLWRVNRNSLQWSLDRGERWTTVVNSGAQPDGLLPAHHGFAVRDPQPFAQVVFNDAGVLYLYGWGCQGLWYSWDGVTFEQHLIQPDDPSSDHNCVGNIAVDPLSHHVYVTSLRVPQGLERAVLWKSNAAWRFGEPPPAFGRYEVGGCVENTDCIGGGLCTAGACPPPNAAPSLRTPASMVSAARPGDLGDHRIVIRNSVPPDTYVFHWCPAGTSSSSDCCEERAPNGACLRRKPLWERFAPTTTSVEFARSLTYVREGGADELFVGDFEFQHSLDLGRTWTPYVLPLILVPLSYQREHVDTNAVYYDIDLGFVWTGNDGAYHDGLSTNITRWAWQPGYAPGCTSPTSCPGGSPVPHTNLAVWQAYFVAPVPPASSRLPRRVFVGTVDNGGGCFDDASADSARYTPSLGGDVFSMAFAPSNPNVAYVLTHDGMYRLNNARAASDCGAVRSFSRRFDFTDTFGGGFRQAGGEWSRAMLAAHPTDLDRFYVVAFERVVRGEWLPSSSRIRYELSGSDPAPGYATTSVFAERRGFGPSTRVIVGTAGAGVHVSLDDGDSWSPWGTLSPPPALVFTIERGGTAGAPTYYLATTSGVFYGNPSRGIDWQRAATAERYAVSDVEVDPTEPCRVYAAVGYAGSLSRSRGGILVSTDYGRTFPFSLTASSGIALHQGPVTDVEVDERSPRFVYAASFGHGFWVHDWTDRGALPACTP